MRSGRELWLIPAVLTVLLGSGLAVFGAQALARAGDQRAHQTFVTSAGEIAATLELAIEREQDLGVNASSFVLDNPSATEATFQQWTASSRLYERYSELLGIGEVVLVPASGLGAFAAAHGGSDFQVSPPGDRPYYCFTTFTQGRTSASVLPPDIDACATALGPALISGRDSGLSTYVPYGTGRNANLAIGAPVYVGGRVPDTEAARTASFVGWVGIQIVPRVLLTTALEGHPATNVVFHYRVGSSVTTFSSGSAGPGADATTIDLHNGWHVRVSATTTGGGLVGTPAALALLLTGILVSLLLGVLLYVLGTGRSRALQLVHERTDQLHHQALHDPLTGLPNRALILDRIDRMLARGRREHASIGVLFLDLDNFKDINDTLGHRAGDELLVAVGSRLAGALRQGDTVGRLGGDEFVVVTDGNREAGGAAVVAERMLEVLATPFDLPGNEAPLTVSASIGYAEGDRPTPEQLLQDADIALYEAKGAGKRRAVGFSQSMRETVDDHRQLGLDLRGALHAHQFFLVYQPTVDLTSGVFTGFEALIRWQHPERGVVMPDQFIPALESSGLINPVGGWVLEEACRHGAALVRRGFPLKVSVNVSARQLERDRIADDVHRALTASGLSPEMLIVELTETSLMHDVEATIDRLHLLKAVGVKVAIDDFGTGYSSLAYLRRLPIDILKIDRSFVSGITDTPEAPAIVHTLVQLGKALGLEIIAEGIETEEQRRCLAEEGVDNGQGYLFARPMEFAALERLLVATGPAPGLASAVP